MTRRILRYGQEPVTVIVASVTAIGNVLCIGEIMVLTTRQCVATSKTSGERCKNPPIPGGTVCRRHGGAAPQVEAAAARNILEGLVGPALAKMREILNDPDTPPQVRLAAVRDILDRTGFKPVTQMEVLTIGAIEAEISRLEAQMGG